MINQKLIFWQHLVDLNKLFKIFQILNNLQNKNKAKIKILNFYKNFIN